MLALRKDNFAILQPAARRLRGDGISILGTNSGAVNSANNNNNNNNEAMAEDTTHFVSISGIETTIMDGQLSGAWLYTSPLSPHAITMDYSILVARVRDSPYNKPVIFFLQTQFLSNAWYPCFSPYAY